MRFKIYMILTGIIFLFTNCNDVLDRPSLTTSEDDAYWTSEDRVRLYANAFYTNFFVGYGLKYETTYAPNANYTFNDDAVRLVHPKRSLDGLSLHQKAQRVWI